MLTYQEIMIAVEMQASRVQGTYTPLNYEQYAKMDDTIFEKMKEVTTCQNINTNVKRVTGLTLPKELRIRHLNDVLSVEVGS